MENISRLKSTLSRLCPYVLLIVAGAFLLYTNLSHEASLKEGLWIALVDEFARGAQLFDSDYSVFQLAATLMLPLQGLHDLLLPQSYGLVLFYRYAYGVLALIVSVIVLKVLSDRSNSKVVPFLVAFGVLLFCPDQERVLSAYSIGFWALLLSLLTLVTCSKSIFGEKPFEGAKRVLLPLFSGLLLAMAALCMPWAHILAVIVFIAIFVFGLAAHKNKALNAVLWLLVGYLIFLALYCFGYAFPNAGGAAAFMEGLTRCFGGVSGYLSVLAPDVLSLLVIVVVLLCATELCASERFHEDELAQAVENPETEDDFANCKQALRRIKLMKCLRVVYPVLAIALFVGGGVSFNVSATSTASTSFNDTSSKAYAGVSCSEEKAASYEELLTSVATLNSGYLEQVVSENGLPCLDMPAEIKTAFVGDSLDVLYGKDTYAKHARALNYVIVSTDDSALLKDYADTVVSWLSTQENYGVIVHGNHFELYARASAPESIG